MQRSEDAHLALLSALLECYLQPLSAALRGNAVCVALVNDVSALVQSHTQLAADLGKSLTFLAQPPAVERS